MQLAWDIHRWDCGRLPDEWFDKIIAILLCERPIKRYMVRDLVLKAESKYLSICPECEGRGWLMDIYEEGDSSGPYQCPICGGTEHVCVHVYNDRTIEQDAGTCLSCQEIEIAILTK